MKATSTQSFISVYTVHVTGPQMPEKVWKSARMCTNPVSHIYTVHFIHIQELIIITHSPQCMEFCMKAKLLQSGLLYTVSMLS